MTEVLELDHYFEAVVRGGAPVSGPSTLETANGFAEVDVSTILEAGASAYNSRSSVPSRDRCWNLRWHVCERRYRSGRSFQGRWRFHSR